MKEWDLVDKVFIVEHGHLEVFIEVDGNDFILERLKQGSVLNPYNIFLEDRMYPNVRAYGPTKLKYIGVKDINDLMIEDPLLEKEILVFQNKLFRIPWKINLDYIISTIGDHEKEKTLRRIILKNLVTIMLQRKEYERNRMDLSSLVNQVSKRRRQSIFINIEKIQ